MSADCPKCGVMHWPECELTYADGFEDGRASARQDFAELVEAAKERFGLAPLCPKHPILQFYGWDRLQAAKAAAKDRIRLDKFPCKCGKDRWEAALAKLDK